MSWRRFLLLGIAFLLSFCRCTAYGQETESEETFDTELAQGFLGEMELEEVQRWVDQMLPEENMQVREMILELWKGNDFFSREELILFIQKRFFSRMENERKQFGRILLLILVGAVFYNLSKILENGKLGEVSFYVVYLVLFLILGSSFLELVEGLHVRIQQIVAWMQGLTPAYYLAIATAGGIGQAGMFYQMILLLVGLFQWGIGKFLLPAAQMYVLLSLVNHLSKEEMISNFAKLLHMSVKGSLKTLLGFVTGLQVLKSLMLPVLDRLKRSVIGKTASAIPGVGGAVNAVTEIVLTSAVLVRNCMGVTFLIILGMWGLEPMLHYGLLSLFYKLTAALSEPVSDKRLVEALNTMGEGCSLLLHIFFSIQLLCMITIVILAVSLS